MVDGDPPQQQAKLSRLSCLILCHRAWMAAVDGKSWSKVGKNMDPERQQSKTQSITKAIFSRSRWKIGATPG
jgi:hypothetical protein